MKNFDYISYIVGILYNRYLDSDKNNFILEDELFRVINNYTSKNNDDENIQIINNFSGDIISTIKRYNIKYENIDINNESINIIYSKIAYYSIRYDSNVYIRITKLINNKK